MHHSRDNRTTRAPVACLLGLLLSGASGSAQEIERFSIDAGGGRSEGGSYQLTSSVAQADAHPQQSSGGRFVLAGGFWARASDRMFRDGFEGE